jgi:hypothetical protein
MEAKEISKGIQIEKEAQNLSGSSHQDGGPKSSLSPPRNQGPVCLELVTQDTYGLRFR